MKSNRFLKLGSLAVAQLLLVILAGGSAWAQEFRGTISGTVKDPSGAVIPSAAVTVQEAHTGTVNRTTSDSAGAYTVPFLLPGDYTVTVTLTGFETVTRSGIALQSQEHPIVDIELPIGRADQVVTVSGAPPLIDQANASVGQVISTRSVENLPLNGRTPAVLTELSVGVITTSAPGITHPFDNNAANAWSIGGTPNQVSEILMDGGPDLTLLGALAYSPTQDSVQEISIHPFDTDASFGHTIGGVINQVTKSGTNGLHGTLYEFGQISDLDANLYFNSVNKTPTPVTHFNQYGLTVGGPVYVPKIFNGRDKLFFFFAWERLKDSTPASTLTTVPTAAERTGDFSQTLAAGCPTGYANNPATAAAICNPDPALKQNSTYADPNQLYNPFSGKLAGSTITRSPLLNNQLTAATSAFNPVALNYLNLIPLPNNASGAAADGQDNYLSDAPSVDTYNNEFGRLDYNLSSRNHVFFDFRHNHRTQIKNDYFGNGLTGTTLLRENFGTTLDDVFTLNSTTVFDARFNWTYFDEVHGTPAQAFSPTSVGLPSSLNSASEFLQLPFINFATGGSCGSFTSYQCLGDTTSALDPTTSYQVFADVVKVIGRHTLKVGFDGRRYGLRVQSFGDSSGSFTFNSNFVTSGSKGTAQTFGGDLASFLFGLPGAGEYDLEARADYRSYYIGSVVQDDWRVSDRLTLNMGLRFDIDTPFGDKFGRTVSGFDPTAVNSASSAAAAAFAAHPNASITDGFNTLGGLTYPSSHGGAPYQTNSGFLSPRFGFAYTPPGFHNKTVVRGGFGIFVQPETLASLAATGSFSSTALSNQEGFSASTTYTATTNNFLTSAGTLSNPFPSGFAQPLGSSQGASTFLGQAISFLAPVQHDPYSERYNLGVQHELTSNTMVEALYVGNHSVHLPIAQQNLNATKLAYLTTAPFRNQNLATADAASVANPFAGLLPNGGSFNGATTAVSNLQVPYPQYGNSNVLDQNQTIGQSYFNSALLHIEQRASHGLTLSANYGFSKLIEADTFLNDEDTSPTRRVSPFDHTHHFTVGATYHLPFGRNEAINFGGSRLLDQLLGGFVINSIYQFQTGAPIEFSADIPLQPGETVRNISVQPRNTSAAGSGTPALKTSVFVTGNQTSCPTTTPGCDLSGQTFFNGQYFDHLRTLPQTISTVRQDGFNNLDASVLKNINFTEKTYIQLRFETFNTLNHPVFAAPAVSSATSSSFGYITAVPSTAQPRQVQLGARIVF